METRVLGLQMAEPGPGGRRDFIQPSQTLRRPTAKCRPTFALCHPPAGSSHKAHTEREASDKWKQG
eukprot:10197674-Heterocapsa_arctica.AAC.1